MSMNFPPFPGSANSPEIALTFMQDASLLVKEQCKQLWSKYLGSITRGRPQIYLQKDLAEQLGYPTIMTIAERLCTSLQEDVVVVEDLNLKAYIISTRRHLSATDIYQFHDEVKYVPRTFSSPRVQAEISFALPVRAAPLITTRPNTTRSSISRIRAQQPKIPKPPNMWILYRQEKQALLRQEHPDMPNTELSKMISEMWQNESREVREHYSKLADEKREERQKTHPGWKCAPRKSHEIKRMKRRNQRGGPASVPRSEPAPVPTSVPEPQPLFTYSHPVPLVHRPIGPNRPVAPRRREPVWTDLQYPLRYLPPPTTHTREFADTLLYEVQLGLNYMPSNVYLAGPNMN